jgi:hypothetical protein
MSERIASETWQSDLALRVGRTRSVLRESTTESRGIVPNGGRVGATHRRKALPPGGLHPPYSRPARRFGTMPVPDSVLNSPKERASRHLRLVLLTAIQARAIKTAKIGENPVIVNFV